MMHKSIRWQLAVRFAGIALLATLVLGAVLLFIVRNNVAKWCYVETGRENDEYVEINSSSLDLKEGDHVLTDGHFTLVHDALVKIVE